jgi:hypothetical protein
MTNPTELFHRRYGVDAFNADIPWNETISHLLSHRSIRAYLSDPLPSNTLETLVAAAKRVAFAESLSGRDRLQEALKNLGFELR